MLDVGRSRITVENQLLIQGDCLRTLSELETGSVDVVVTSPPYNLSIPYATYNDNREEDEYLNWMSEVFASVSRVLRKNGSLFLNVAGSASRPWFPFEVARRLRESYHLQNHMIWVKSISVGLQSTGHFKPIPGHRFTHHNHEHIFHFTPTGKVELDRLSIGVPFMDKTNIGRRGHPRDLRCRGNTWFIPYKTVQSRAGKFAHPSTFPVELPLWCIFLHGVSNPVVLDPFVGSGTTLVAARLAEAKGIGLEIDRSYIETAAQRLASTMRNAMDIKLTETEMKELLSQDPSTRGDGGFQSLLVRLQDKLNRSTGHMTLTEEDIAAIHRYAEYTQGGWQDRLISIFGRSIGLQKAA